MDRFAALVILFRHVTINVFSVSGDGLLHEVFNGLFEREDWRVSCQVPVGVIIIIITIIIIIMITITYSHLEPAPCLARPAGSSASDTVTDTGLMLSGRGLESSP